MLQHDRASKKNTAKRIPKARVETPPPPTPVDAAGAGHPPLSEKGRQAAEDRTYLIQLGERVRELRARRGMSRKILAHDSGLSERYLAQLEAGQGNMSIVLLRQLSRALDTPLEVIVHDGPEPPIELSHSIELIRRLEGAELERVHRLLVDEFAKADIDLRRRRIALIGLRGAGKSTLGTLLAKRLGVSFVELDRDIERESGMPLSILFDLYGQPAFRRFERRCLDRLVEQQKPLVIATGGSLVSEPATFERLLSCCFTIWIKATPATHMERVIAQGDMRPMSNNREAMADLQRILKVREALYRRADAQIDTTGRTPEESADAIMNLIQ